MAIDRKAYTSLTESVLKSTGQLDEGSYVHSKGELKKAVKGSKKEIGKAYKKGDKKAMKSWLENKKDAEDQLKEEVDPIDLILAEGIELYGEEGMTEILADFAETGEISEELAGLIEAYDSPAPAPKKGKKGKTTGSKGDCMYESDIDEDLQSPARTEQMYKKAADAKTRRGRANIIKRASKEEFSRKLYGRDGKVLKRKPNPNDTGFYPDD